MKKEVIIKVKGVQGGLDDSEEIEMLTEGEYFVRAGKYYIKYVDRMLDTEHETPTTIKIDGAVISIIRFGSANTHMIFEEGKTHYSPYETPFGLFDLMLRTQKVSVNIQDDSLSLKVDYHLEVNQESFASSVFELEVRSKNN